MLDGIRSRLPDSRRPLYQLQAIATNDTVRPVVARGPSVLRRRRTRSRSGSGFAPSTSSPPTTILAASTKSGPPSMAAKRPVGRSTSTTARSNMAAKIPPIRRRLAGCWRSCSPASTQGWRPCRAAAFTGRIAVRHRAPTRHYPVRISRISRNNSAWYSASCRAL